MVRTVVTNTPHPTAESKDTACVVMTWNRRTGRETLQFSYDLRCRKPNCIWQDLQRLNKICTGNSHNLWWLTPWNAKVTNAFGHNKSNDDNNNIRYLHVLNSLLPWFEEDCRVSDVLKRIYCNVGLQNPMALPGSAVIGLVHWPPLA